MIEAYRTLSAPSLSASLTGQTVTGPSLSARLVRRRRSLMLAPPAVYATPSVYAVMPALPVDAADDAPRWIDWRADMRFFVGCYAAGLIFFLIMLS
jgi:hypothetical protein